MNTLYRIFGEDLSILIPHFDIYKNEKDTSVVFHNTLNNRVAIIRFDNIIIKNLGFNDDIYLKIEKEDFLIKGIYHDIITRLPKSKYFISNRKLEYQILLRLNKR